MATALQGPVEAPLRPAAAVGWEGDALVGVLAGEGAEQRVAVDQEVVQVAAEVAVVEAGAGAVVVVEVEEAVEEVVVVAEEILSLYTCFNL